jgi:uncharacterized protein (TIGR01777 family)
MRVLITGAHGLIGHALSTLLGADGHRVLSLTRSKFPTNEREISWNPDTGTIEKADLEGFDAIVHLAGESIVGRWTPQKKARILESRVKGTRLLCETLAGLHSRPMVLISASAVGYYGEGGNKVLTENSPVGSLFLSRVAQAWEEATKAVGRKGIRVVNLRIGFVLSKQGGGLAAMLRPFKLGIGGRVGNGHQYLSWIALDDLARSISHAILTDSLRGPVNAVSPHPATNREFTKALGRVLGRPTIFPLPAFAARIALGEMADELLLASARATPDRLLASGFEFQFPELEEALRHVLRKA